MIGILAFLIGVSNSGMTMIEKGYYFTCLMFGLFAAVSLQKSVRDRLEGVPVTALYFGLAWTAVGLSILLTAVTVQKNVRDVNASESGLMTRPPEFERPSPPLEPRLPDLERLPEKRGSSVSPGNF